MSFWICRSCRQSFPSDLLEQASFTDHVGKRFSQMRDTLSLLLEDKKNSQHLIHEALTNLEDLCAAVHEEVGILTEKIKKAKMRYHYDEKTGEHSSKTETRKQKNDFTRLKKSADCPKQLPAVLNTRNQVNRSVHTNANAAALTSMMVSNNIPEYNRRKMCNAFELTSVSVYSILESLAVHTRVDCAFLWIRPRGAITNELVAPFVVGRDVSKLAHSAPYRLAENSMPCVVAETGIGINIKPICGVRDEKPNSNILLAEFIERTSAAQLLIPVYKRYWSKSRFVLAVIHLIGSPRFPYPFDRYNEEVAAVAANLLSVVLSSHYEVMVAEWANHFYDPSVLHDTSSYRGDLDLQGDTKGVDHFTPPPILIYRETKQRNEQTNSREASKALRLSMMRRAVPLHLVTQTRDLLLQGTNVEEEHWGDSLPEMKNRLESIIQAQSDENSFKGANRMRKISSSVSTSGKRDDGQVDSSSERKSWLAKTADNFIETQASSADVFEATSAKSPAFETHNETKEEKQLHFMASKYKQPLKPEELTEIELAALQRLKSMDVDTAPLTTE